MGASSSVAARQVTPLLLRALSTMTGSLHTHPHPAASHLSSPACHSRVRDTPGARHVVRVPRAQRLPHLRRFATCPPKDTPNDAGLTHCPLFTEWTELLTGDRGALAQLLALDAATADALYINAHAAARLWAAVKAFQRDFFARVLDGDDCARGADYLPSTDAFDSTDLCALVALAQKPDLDGSRLSPPHFTHIHTYMSTCTLLLVLPPFPRSQCCTTCCAIWRAL